MDKLSYALGIGIGTQLSEMGAKELNIDDFAQAIKDILSGTSLKMEQGEAQQLLQKILSRKGIQASCSNG